MNFSGKKCKKWPVSWKSTNTHRFGQNLQLLEETTMFWHFDDYCRRKLQKGGKGGSFREKWRKIIDLAKTFNFSSKLPCLGIFMNFSARSCKKLLIPWKRTRNHRFGQNYATFSNKLPCLCISINFSGKSCKKCLVSWKARKIIDLAKALQLLEQATMSFSFWWTFKKKVAKSASSREKAPKIIDFLNLQLSEKTTMFWHFDEHCSKMLQKAARAVKKHEKSSIWPNLCNFSNKLRCFCISMNFQGKSCQKWLRFVKKHEKSSIWPKLCNFSSKLPCFGISINFSAKSYKKSFVKKHEKSSKKQLFEQTFRWTFQEKCLISWKSTKNHRFGQNLQLFQTTMFWHFDVFSKKTKSASFREKARKIVDLAKTRNFSNKLPCFDALVNFSAKSCRKCLVFWENSKNHRLGQDLQLFRTK